MCTFTLWDSTDLPLPLEACKTHYKVQMVAARANAGSRMQSMSASQFHHAWCFSQTSSKDEEHLQHQLDNRYAVALGGKVERRGSLLEDDSSAPPRRFSCHLSRCLHSHASPS